MDNAKILVVEDEPLIGMELQETIEGMGYEVPRVIDSADDIFGAFEEIHPDLVLMDIKLRSFNDGIDAARRIRLFSDVPIIYLTAYTSEETRKCAEATLPSAFLAKPVSESILSKEIRKAIKGSRKD